MATGAVTGPGIVSVVFTATAGGNAVGSAIRGTCATTTGDLPTGKPVVATGRAAAATVAATVAVVVFWAGVVLEDCVVLPELSG